MRRFRFIALGAMAAMAMTLVAGAAMASATPILAEQYPASLSGTTLTGLGMNFGIGSVSKCNGNLSGSATTPSATTSVSIPAEDKCEGATAPVKSNGCKFALHPGTETSPGHFGGTFDIAAGCSGLSTSYFGCPINFPPQSGMSATYENVTWEGKNATVVTLSGGGMEYTRTGSGCGPGTYHDGTLSGSWRLTSSTEGKPYGIDVATKSGFFLTGAGSSSEFEAEKYAVAITAKQTTVEKFEVAAGTAKCEQVNMRAYNEVSTSELLLEPEFVHCKAFGLATTVQTNGCLYLGTVVSSGPYSGVLKLFCPSGKSLEFNAGFGSCILSIPPQVIATSTYENTGTGAERKVVAQMKGEGLEYTQSLGCAEGTGTFHNGVFSGAQTFEGAS